MKFFINILHFLCIIMCVYCITPQEAKKQVEECLTEFDFTKEKLATLRKEQAAELDCFTACIMKKRGTLVDGKIDSEKMLEVLKQLRVLNTDRTEEKFLKCAEAANEQEDECLVAKNMLSCFLSKIS